MEALTEARIDVYRVVQIDTIGFPVCEQGVNENTTSLDEVR